MISIERFFMDNGHLFIFNRKGTKNFRDLQIIMLFCAQNLEIYKIFIIFAQNCAHIKSHG